MTSIETPMLPNAFDMSDDEKIVQISHHFGQIIDILGLDRSDDSLSGTPHRVAKMYVKEIFSGLNPANKPDIKLFDNKYKYNEMLIEKDITFYSNCEHHFVPIIGKAHIAYIPNGKVVGLSKIPRVVDVFARRLQIQEQLTEQICDALNEHLKPKGVAVMIDARHMCMEMRGVEKICSTTVTSALRGLFKSNKKTKDEFLSIVASSSFRK